MGEMTLLELSKLKDEFRKTFGFYPWIGARQSRKDFAEAIQAALKSGQVPEEMRPRERDKRAIED
jgi:hypothetical protein